MPPQPSSVSVRCSEAKETGLSLLRRPHPSTIEDKLNHLTTNQHIKHSNTPDGYIPMSTISKPQSAAEKRLSDLQRKLMKKSHKVTPKRRRVVHHPPAPAQFNQAVPVANRKRPLDLSVPNGSLPNGGESKGPLTLWQRLADARKRLSEQKRPDSRFVSGRRPLDCLEGMKPTIGVTLFAEGYARHDNPDVTGKPGSTAADSAALLKYAYDRNSRDFLNCLDLGFIPGDEDLPEFSKRHYYDGCLVAEIRDWRFGRRNTVGVKILLRPDMASVYADIQTETRHLDANVALAVEQNILKAIAGPIDCLPNPARTGPCRRDALLDTSVQSNTYAYNLGRRPKRRRIIRPVGPPMQPRLSTAALLLISEAEKQQALHWHAQQGARVAAPAMDARGQKLANGPLSHQVSAFGTGAGGSGPGKLCAVATSKGGLKVKPSLRKPPAMLMDLHLDKGMGSFASSKIPPSNSSAAAKVPQERLRSVRLILPDANSRFVYERAMANYEAALRTEVAETIKSANEARTQALQGMSQAGRQVYVLEMVRNPIRGIEMVVFRGLCGDKTKDMFRVNVLDEEHGHAFLDQYKRITRKEGYVCIHDANAADYQKQQLQAQQQQQRSRQSGNGIARHPMSARGQGGAKNQNSPQTKVAALSARSAQSLSQGLTAQQQLLQTQQKQKQKQLQRQQQQQQQLQRQRQQQQQNAHIPMAGPLHMQQVSPQQQLSHHQGSVHNAAQQMTLGQVGQHQLSQGHPQQLALRQQQLFRQQIHQQQQQLEQQHQNVQRARRLQQQIQRHDKSGSNLQQSSAVVLGPTGRGGQILAKGGSGVQGNVAGMARGGGITAALNSSPVGSLGSTALLGHNQLFPPSHLQRIQQLQSSRQQQLRTQEQHRNMMAAVGGPDGNGPFPRQANNITAQRLRTQALAAAIGSAAMGNGAGRGATGGSLAGSDPLATQRIQQHFKQQQQQQQQQRENVEAQSRIGKR